MTSVSTTALATTENEGFYSMQPAQSLSVQECKESGFSRPPGRSSLFRPNMLIQRPRNAAKALNMQFKTARSWLKEIAELLTRLKFRVTVMDLKFRHLYSP